jgi:hypothetical protein
VDYYANALLNQNTGGVLTKRDELEEKYPTVFIRGESDKCGSYSSAQIGQALLAFSESSIHFRKKAGDDKYADKLLERGGKVADFIVQYATEETMDHGCVLRSCLIPYDLNMEKRQLSSCLVYDGWVLSGFSYFCYAYALKHHELPEKYKVILCRSSERLMDIMRNNNGEADPKCYIERRSHLWLGNLYAGEGLLGAFLAFNELGNKELAKKMGEGARMALANQLKFVRNPKYSNLDFDKELNNLWSNGYATCLFMDYCDLVKEEPSFREIIQILHSRLMEVFYEKHGGAAYQTTPLGALLRYDLVNKKDHYCPVKN